MCDCQFTTTNQQKGQFFYILLSPCIFTNSIYFTPTNAHVKPLFCNVYCKMYPYTCFDPADDPRIETRVGVHFIIKITKKSGFTCVLVGVK